MNRSTLSLSAVVALAMHCIPALAVAQRTPPSSAQCTSWSQALGGGGAGALGALLYGGVGGCPSTGPNALASAITNSASTTDTSFLWALIRQAGSVGHPTIFNAAVSNARNSAASTSARAASLLILTAQLGLAPHLSGRPLNSELTGEIPTTGLCGPDLSANSQLEPAAQALPSDAKRQVAVVFDALQADVHAPAQLSTLARCLRPAVGRNIPPQIDLSGVTLRYLYCNRFVVSNPTVFSLPMGVEVVGTTEHFGWSASPGETRFSTDNVGTVRLIYDGGVIRTAANGGVACD
jgi:hypothetical protein